MLNATFYIFSKKDNSTKLPSSSTTHINTQININDNDSSLVYPQIRVAFPVGENGVISLLPYNYVYISNFARYYWVTDWHYNADGTWTASCKVDVLASWVGYFYDMSGFVNRCPEFPNSGGIRDNYIVDPAFPPTNDFKVFKGKYPTGMTPDISDGAFVLGVISDKSPNVGAVSYYVVSSAQLAVLMNNMVTNSNSTWADVDSLDSDVLKSLINPMQFVVSCKWFPFGIIVNTSPTYISLWGWNTGAYGYKLQETHIQIPTANNYYHLQLQDIDITYPESMSDYPYFAPYAEYSIITPWGSFDLDPNAMAKLYMTQYTPQTRLLDYCIMVNLVSGTGTFIVETQGYEFFRREINVGLDIPLAQVSLNYVSMAKSAISAAGKTGDVGAWMSNPVGNAAGIASDLIDATAASLSPAVQSTGSTTAAFTPLIEDIVYQMRRYRRVQAHHGQRAVGYPAKHYCQYLRDALSSLTESGVTRRFGYIQVDYISSWLAPCTDEERTMIVDYFKTGVHFEVD